MPSPGDFLKWGSNGLALGIVGYSYLVLRSALPSSNPPLDPDARRDLLKTARYFLGLALAIFAIAILPDLLGVILRPQLPVVLHRSPAVFPDNVPAPVVQFGADKGVELSGDSPLRVVVGANDSIEVQVDRLTDVIRGDRVLIGRLTQEVTGREAGQQGFDDAH